MKRSLTLSTLLLVITIFLAACGGAATPSAGNGQDENSVPPATGEGSTPLPVEEETPPPADEGTPPTSDTEPKGLDNVDAALLPLVMDALKQLATETGVAMEAMRVVTVSEEEWANSGLGCPQAGQMYLDVITPGYNIVIDADGDTFEVHTDREGNSMVVCGEQADPRGDVPEMPEGDLTLPDELATLPARVAENVGVSEDDLTVVSIDQVQWSDSSLGCPDPATSYLQVVTPGYVVLFETTTGSLIQAHTDMNGNFVVCLSQQ